jgi:glycosyltransferase involved in cell wall biosynthesis
LETRAIRSRVPILARSGERGCNPCAVLPVLPLDDDRRRSTSHAWGKLLAGPTVSAPLLRFSLVITEPHALTSVPNLSATSAPPRSRQHVVFSIDTMSVGGTEMNALRTAEQLTQRGFRVTVVTLRGEGPLAARYASLGIAVERFPIRSLYAPATIRQAIRLAKFLRRERVSIVHCHDQYSNFFSVLSARMAGVSAVIASKRWLHSPLRYRIANAIGFRAASCVLANSEGVAQSLERDDYIKRSRTVVIPNFVDDAAFAPPPPEAMRRWRESLALDDATPIIGIVASLLAIKDHATLLHSVVRLVSKWPALRVVIVGDGPEREPLERLASQLGITAHVRFAGHQPNVPSLHHLFDVSVLTSVSEGFPNSLVEAMAAGRPVVATNVGGVPDAVQHDETGVLVPPGDARALADALHKLLSDPACRERMGAAGARRARSEYHATAVMDSLTRLYDHLLGSPSR